MPWSVKDASSIFFILAKIKCRINCVVEFGTDEILVAVRYLLMIVVDAHLWITIQDSLPWRIDGF